MSQVFRLRYRTLFATGLAIALASLGIYLHPARVTGQVPLRTHASQIRELQEERLTTLRKIVGLVDQKCRHGSASLAEFALVKRNAAEAELEICVSQAERVMALEKIVEDAKALESRATQHAQSNLAFQEIALAMKADWLASKIRLELARAELSSELNGSGKE